MQPNAMIMQLLMTEQGRGPCRIILTDVVRKSVGRSMRTLRKGFVAPKWLICVCMGLLIVGQSYTVATMFVTHHGSSRNWGLFIRFGIPIILYWCMWKVPEKNIKPIYFLLATSCLLYSNSFVFSNHFGLALSMVMAAVLTSILAFYKVLISWSAKNG